MPRPKRPRYIISHPSINTFGPKGVRACEEIIISLDEFEAIRLIDYDGMDQSEAAKIMNVSRQTVGRILKAGRGKLSTMLVLGHSLKLEGGCYKIGEKPVEERGRGHHGRGRGCGRRSNGLGPGPGRGKNKA